MSEETIFQQLEICQKQRDTALSQLAALREELADRKRKHLRSCSIAIGKSQLAKERHAELIQLREELDTMTAGAKALRDEWRVDQHRLADAERRIVELVGSVKGFFELGDRIRKAGRPPHTDFWNQSIQEAEERMRNAAINKPE